MMPKGDVLGALIETTPFDIELPSVALISEQRKRGKKKQPPLCEAASIVLLDLLFSFVECDYLTL
jgi:hypothetical protein